MTSKTAFGPITGVKNNPRAARPKLNDNMRGLVVLIAASVALVAIAYGAMVALTSPGGWAMKVAGDAMAGEAATLTSFVELGAAQ